LFLLVIVLDFGFDIPGLSTMYLNLREARSG
jgi:hypothetical protein